MKLGELGEMSFSIFSILAFSTNFCPRIDYPYLKGRQVKSTLIDSNTEDDNDEVTLKYGSKDSFHSIFGTT